MPGFVSLVGAGPGDPGLITVRGRRAVERADVVLYDQLASPALLASLVVPGQERIHVGKTAGAGLSSQEAINELLVRRALSNQRVVRLKGGDPFVFGRGGEEAQACAAAGVAFEVVPGVSALQAVPMYAGIPITHRGRASLVTAVTAHQRAGSDDPAVDWAALAHVGGTLVVFMGVLAVARWTRELMDAGMSPETPAAVVRLGTRSEQTTRVATLGTLAAEVKAAGLRPPAVVVLGAVVGLRDTLCWFDSRPLFGQVVGVTRASPDREPFELLEDLGAAVVHLPLTRQQLVEDPSALDAAVSSGVGSAGAFTDLVFTSANGVAAFAASLERVGRDVRALVGVATWAVGPGTARAMRTTLALGADHIPRDATGEGLVALAAEVGVAGRRFLFPAAVGARRTVPEGVAGLGAIVDQIPAYETVADPKAPSRLESALEQGLSMVAVASPSAVDALLDALAHLGEAADRVPLAAIGPTTAARARERGADLAVVATTHTMAGLAEAIAGHVTAGGTT